MCPNKLKPPKYNPLTYKTSSLFLLKASYQRHMLIAMLLGSLIVVGPILASVYLSDLFIDDGKQLDSIKSNFFKVPLPVFDSVKHHITLNKLYFTKVYYYSIKSVTLLGYFD